MTAESLAAPSGHGDDGCILDLFFRVFAPYHHNILY